MPKPKTGKGVKPPSRKNLKNPKGTEIVSLNFRVEEKMRYDFKLQALLAGKSQVKLLLEAFYEWKEKHPL